MNDNVTYVSSISDRLAKSKMNNVIESLKNFVTCTTNEYTHQDYGVIDYCGPICVGQIIPGNKRSCKAGTPVTAMGIYIGDIDQDGNLKVVNTSSTSYSEVISPAYIYPDQSTGVVLCANAAGYTSCFCRGPETFTETVRYNCWMDGDGVFHIDEEWTCIWQKETLDRCVYDNAWPGLPDFERVNCTCVCSDASGNPVYIYHYDPISDFTLATPSSGLYQVKSVWDGKDEQRVNYWPQGFHYADAEGTITFDEPLIDNANPSKALLSCASNRLAEPYKEAEGFERSYFGLAMWVTRSASTPPNIGWQWLDTGSDSAGLYYCYDLPVQVNMRAQMGYAHAKRWRQSGCDCKYVEDYIDCSGSAAVTQNYITGLWGPFMCYDNTKGCYTISSDGRLIFSCDIQTWINSHKIVETYYKDSKGCFAKPTLMAYVPYATNGCMTCYGSECTLPVVTTDGVSSCASPLFCFTMNNPTFNLTKQVDSTVFSEPVGKLMIETRSYCTCCQVRVRCNCIRDFSCDVRILERYY